MEEENNVIYSYVQAGDQNDGVVMSTGKISIKFGLSEFLKNLDKVGKIFLSRFYPDFFQTSRAIFFFILNGSNHVK